MSGSLILMTALWMQAGDAVLPPAPIPEPIVLPASAPLVARRNEIERLERQLQEVSERLRQLQESQPMIVMQVLIAEVPTERVGSFQSALAVLTEKGAHAHEHQRVDVIDPRVAQALLTAVGATTISRPQIRTIDGQSAEIHTRLAGQEAESLSKDAVQNARDFELRFTPCLLPDHRISCQIVQKIRETAMNDVTTVDVRQRETGFHADLQLGKTYCLTETGRSSNFLVLMVSAAMDHAVGQTYPSPMSPPPHPEFIEQRYLPVPAPAFNLPVPAPTSVRPLPPAPPAEQPQATRSGVYLLPLTRIILDRGEVKTAAGSDAEEPGVGPH